MPAFANAIALAVFAAPAFGHMMMTFPPALRAPQNPQYNESSVDHSYLVPLHIDGSDFPCKGYHTDVPSISTATATLKPGSNFTVSLKGLTNYQGGSCQFALSYDSGSTWGAIESIIGNCPSATEVEYTFRVPAGLPDAKDALFAWAWFNNVGNREFYMNCASVDVVGAPGSQQEDYVAQRMFEANIFDSRCTTIESQPVDFANPVLQSCPPEMLVTPDQTVTFRATSGTVPIPTDMEEMPTHTDHEHHDVPSTATSSPSNSTTLPPTTATAPIAWSADRVFVSGDAVCESGINYTAKWWTKGNKPEASDVWVKGGTC